MKKQLFPLNLAHLQYFAEQGAESASDGAPEGAGAEAQEQHTEEFKAIKTQSELDSLTNKAVQKALEKYKRGEAERIKEALEREKDYSKLSDEDRARKEFEDERAEFEEAKAAFEHEKLVIQIEKDLVAKGLPSELAETFAMQGEADKALDAVKVFEEAFNKAVGEKVKESLRQNPPGSSGGGSATSNYGERLASSVAGASGKII